MNGLSKFLAVVVVLQVICFVYTVTEHRDYLKQQYLDEYVLGRGETTDISQETWVWFNLEMPLFIQLFFFAGSIYALKRSLYPTKREM